MLLYSPRIVFGARRHNKNRNGKINTENLADQLPLGLFSEQENKIIDVMRGKPGTMTLTSQEAGTESTAFNITYDFDGDNSEATSYLLDLIKSLYVITK